jgi:hypothetical protein
MEQAQQGDTKHKVDEKVSVITSEDIKYIAIETINKDDKDASAVVSGLFKGIKIRKNETTEADETFFMVHDEKDSTFVLNNEFYNVISIEVLEETVRTMTYFMMTDEDQITANLMLSNLMVNLAEKKMVLENDSTMVDIKKFKEVPEEVLKGNTIAVKSGAHTSGVGASKTYIPTTYVRKEATPLLWKRRSKMPTSEALTELASKVSSLETGELKINTPKLSEDDEKKDEKATEADVVGAKGITYNEDDYPYGGMY